MPGKSKAMTARSGPGGSGATAMGMWSDAARSSGRTDRRVRGGFG